MIERADAVKRLKKALRTITGKTWSVSYEHCLGNFWGMIYPMLFGRMEKEDPNA